MNALKLKIAWLLLQISVKTHGVKKSVTVIECHWFEVAEARYPQKCFIKFSTKQVESNKKKDQKKCRLPKVWKPFLHLLKKVTKVYSLLMNVGYIQTVKAISKQSIYEDKVIITSFKKDSHYRTVNYRIWRIQSSEWHENKENNENKWLTIV